jgi:vacuolar protein sorting-associated protein 35
LDQYLSAVARLQRSVNIKLIVIALVDRFSKFAARNREEASNSEGNWLFTKGKKLGISDNGHLFEVFWEQITELIQVDII